MANAWNQWVLGYNPERQRSFLSRVGFDDATWRTMATVLLGSTALVLLVLTGFLLINLRSKEDDPVQQAWQRFCKKLARRGAARDRSEGPVDYADRVAAQFPQKGSGSSHDRRTLRASALWEKLCRRRCAAAESAGRELQYLNRRRWFAMLRRRSQQHVLRNTMALENPAQAV